MTEHDRSRVRPVAEHDMQIGVAHAGRGDGHLYLAVFRLGELDVGDPHWLARAAEQRGPDPAAAGRKPLRRAVH